MEVAAEFLEEESAIGNSAGHGSLPKGNRDDNTTPGGGPGTAEAQSSSPRSACRPPEAPASEFVVRQGFRLAPKADGTRSMGCRISCRAGAPAAPAAIRPAPSGWKTDRATGSCCRDAFTAQGRFAAEIIFARFIGYFFPGYKRFTAVISMPEVRQGQDRTKTGLRQE
jgi:hypothetical protein